MPRKPTQITHELRKQTNGHVDKWGASFTLQNRGGLTWADAPTEILQAALAAATEDGAALLLSKTSDGGALSIHVLTSAGTHKLYPATAAELKEALQLIYQISVS